MTWRERLAAWWRPLVARPYPQPGVRVALLAGLGGGLTILAVAQLSSVAHVLLLSASLGSSCALVFGMPSSPLAQPANVVAGHILCAAVGLALASLVPSRPAWAAALSVALSIALMMVLRVAHPPAVANALLATTSTVGWAFLAYPIASSAVGLVAIAYLFHRLTGVRYPVTPRPRGPVEDTVSGPVAEERGQRT